MRATYTRLFQKAERLVGKDTMQFFVHARNYITAQFFVSALSFLAIPILTRLLPKEDYGILAIYTSIITLLTVLIGLNIHGAIARYYYEEGGDFRRFLGTNLTFMFVFGVTQCALLYLTRGYWARLFEVPEIVFLVALGTTFFAIPFNIYQSYLQASKQSRQFSLQNVVKYTLILVLAIVAIYMMKQRGLADRYLGRIWVEVAIGGLFFVYVGARMMRLARFGLHWGDLKYALLIGVPLIPHTLSGFILIWFDRIMVNRISGAGDAGLYSLGYNVAMAMDIFAIGINQAWAPVFYEKMNKGETRELADLALKFIKIFCFGGVGLILFAPEAITIMASKEYHEALRVVPLIIIARSFAPYYNLYSQFAFYHKKTFLISVITISVGVVNLAMNAYLIPRYGYISAAWTSITCVFLLFLLQYLNTRFVLKSRVLSLYPLMRPWFAMLAAFELFYLLPHVPGYALGLLIRLGFVALVAFLFWKYWLPPIRRSASGQG